MLTYIYVDGFNLYYGGVKNTSYKWLNLRELFRRLLDPKHDIQAIKYFTAPVSGKFDPDKPLRQQTYIRALKKYIPELSVYQGHFVTQKVSAPLVNPTKKRRFVKIFKTEEKGTDVNLAVHLLNDAWHDRYDCAVIVSNDSDLAEALRFVKEEQKKSIGLLNPWKRHPIKDLMQYADFTKQIRRGVLANS